MEAIVVTRKDGGAYEIPGAAEVESWEEVQEAADEVVHLESLAGWGRWTDVYCVSANGGALDYFVAKETT